jgi:hypothetical protein
MATEDKTAFFITCRTLGDYLVCNTPIPAGAARGAELAGAICRRCALEIIPPAADAGRMIHFAASPQGEELLKSSENMKNLVAEIFRNPGARRQ